MFFLFRFFFFLLYYFSVYCFLFFFFFFFKQMTAYDMRISDWSSDVCSSDLGEVDALVAMRGEFLAAYQNAAYADRYRDLVRRVAQAEQSATGTTRLAAAVARYYFKLMAYKDEYEVARLYTDGEFLKQLEAQFEGDWKLRLHLAPPLLARRDAQEIGREHV